VLDDHDFIIILRAIGIRRTCTFYARQHICYSPYMLAITRPSVRLSVSLSDGWIIEKQLTLGLWIFHHIR